MSTKGLEVEIAPTGREFKADIKKEGDKPINSPAERESRERDGWEYAKAKLVQHEKMSSRDAEAAVRHAREREQARKRDKGR